MADARRITMMVEMILLVLLSIIYAFHFQIVSLYFIPKPCFPQGQDHVASEEGHSSLRKHSAHFGFLATQTVRPRRIISIFQRIQ